MFPEAATSGGVGGAAAAGSEGAGCWDDHSFLELSRLSCPRKNTSKQTSNLKIDRNVCKTYKLLCHTVINTKAFPTYNESVQ